MIISDGMFVSASTFRTEGGTYNKDFAGGKPKA